MYFIHELTMPRVIRVLKFHLISNVLCNLQLHVMRHLNDVQPCQFQVTHLACIHGEIRLANLDPLLEAQQLWCIPIHVFEALNVLSVKG